MMTADNEVVPESQRMSDQAEQKSNKALAQEIFLNKPHESIAYCCGWPTLKALDNAILTLFLPQIALSMLDSRGDRYGLVADAACLPCTVPLAVSVAAGTLLYDGCLFTKKKTEQCM